MSTYKKAIAGFVGFATAVTMSFGTASAATNEELQAQISALLAQITSLQTQLGGAQTGTTVGAYTFAKDLTVGSRGADVTALQNLVGISPATGYFGNLTKAALIKFQTSKGITPAAGYFGPKTRAIANTMGGSTGGTGGVVTPTGSTVSVGLSFDNPASGTIIAGQAIADLAHFTFSNPTGVEAKVTKLIFNRTGISNDTTLSNVYLFDGATRVTDAASVSSGKITFNDPSGLFTIPAGGMKTIALKADILTGTSGQIIGVSLAEVTGTATVTGSFPILGNNQSIASVTGMATVAFTQATPAQTNIDPQTGYVMWSDSITVGNRTVNMNSMTLKNIGSVAVADIGNFQMYVDGTAVGTVVPFTNANGYVTFAFATPIKLVTGSHTLKVIGDIIGGSGKTFKLSLQQAGDVAFIDSELGQPILATSVTLATGGTQTVSSGTLTITKRTDSTAGNITKNASGITYAKFDLKAAGEPIKIENLSVSATQTGNTATTFALRNGALFADGVQVGNTAAINGDANNTLAYTAFNLGSSLIVYPGKPVVLEVRGDVYNTAAASADAIEATDTLKVNLLLGVDNAKRMQTLDYLDSSAVSGNSLTVQTGNLTVSKNTSYASQTIVAPKTAYKIGSFNVISTETENLNLDTITVQLAGDATYAASTTDLYVKYGTKTSSIKTTVDQTASTGTNVFNISETMLPNTTMLVEVYATLASTFVGTLDTNIRVSGTAANSSTAVYGPSSTTYTAGQRITIQGGSIAAALVTDSTLSTKLLVGNTQPKVASFRFTALNDTYTITDIALKASTTGGAITSLVLKSSGMTDKIVFLGSANGSDSVATSSGMSLTVPANNTTGTVVDVYLNLNDVGPNAATSGSNVRIALDTYKAQTSAGESSTTATDIDANLMYVYKTLPTITLVSLPSTTLTNGTKTLSKFTVAADAAGAIGWKTIVWQVSKTAAVTLDRTTVSLIDSNNNTISGTFATSTATQAGTYMFDSAVTSGYLSFTADAEQQITTSETYSLKGVIGGTASNYSFGTYINATSTYAVADQYTDVEVTPNDGMVHFIWTDRSANSHSETTNDWNSDYKIKNLPTDTQTMTGA